MSGYLQALPLLLGIEKGLVDHPHDRGGRTNFGVTQRVYDQYRDLRGLPRRPVDEITVDEVRDLYHVLYWVPAKCDALPWPISHVHFDTSVHHGVEFAARAIQRAVDVEVDGIIGPITLEAVRSAFEADALDGVLDFVGRYLWSRFSLFVDLANTDRKQRTFLRGWCNRLEEVRELYLEAAA